MKKPTLAEKVAAYEHLLHSLYVAYAVTLDRERVTTLLDRIAAWSFAHNGGNGQQSEHECRQNIYAKFHKLNAP